MSQSLAILFSREPNVGLRLPPASYDPNVGAEQRKRSPVYFPGPVVVGIFGNPGV